MSAWRIFGTLLIKWRKITCRLVAASPQGGRTLTLRDMYSCIDSRLDLDVRMLVNCAIPISRLKRRGWVWVREYEKLQMRMFWPVQWFWQHSDGRKYTPSLRTVSLQLQHASTYFLFELFIKAMNVSASNLEGNSVSLWVYRLFQLHTPFLFSIGTLQPLTTS